MRSLKNRLLIIQAVIILIALGLTGWGITYLFERQLERRVNTELGTYLNQIAARVSFDQTGKPRLSGTLADPRFDEIHSGLYWQINNETANRITRSRSLWDVKLVVPTDKPAFGKVHMHYIEGPRHSTLRIHERRLLFKSASGEQAVRLVVALDLHELSIMRSEFISDVATALLILAALLLLAGWVQVTFGLRPLSVIRQSISNIRNGSETRITADMPQEVSPLVDEVNDLLSAQEETLEKAKNRANNLAHGFKTPLTALTTDVKRLRDKGENKIADEIEATSLAMRRQIDRELATARIREIRTMPPVRALPVLKGIVDTVKRTPNGEIKDIQVNCPPDFHIQIDKDDLAEILGNLIENAVRHATRVVQIKAYSEGEYTAVSIEDDGRGISDKMRKAVLMRGVRLDQSAAGTGLGLAIVKDVLEIYDGKLELGSSSLGGLKASFKLPGTTTS